MITLEIPRRAWRSLLQEGMERMLGRARLVTLREQLVCHTLSGGYRLSLWQPIMGSPRIACGTLHLVLCASAATFTARLRSLRPRADPSRQWEATVVVGTGRPVRGRLGACACPPEGPPVPVDILHLTGPGMERLHLTPEEHNPSPWQMDADQMWSRSRGALGPDVWERLAGSRVTIIGCGRHGSLMAATLGAAGVRSVTLVDDDVVELSSLDGMEGVTAEEVGEPKVAAVGASLERRYPWMRIRPVRAQAAAPAGIDAIREADLVIGCTDSLEGVLAVGALSVLHDRPLILLGASIRRTRRGSRELGGEVQVFVPGHPACVVCFGGVGATTDEFHAVRRRVRIPARPRRDLPSGQDFRLERAGSLRSLGSIVVGVATRSLEELMMGRTHRSHWTRIHYDGGHLQSQVVFPDYTYARGECLCPLRDTGDDGLPHLRDWLARSRMAFSGDLR